MSREIYEGFRGKGQEALQEGTIKAFTGIQIQQEMLRRRFSTALVPDHHLLFEFQLALMQAADQNGIMLYLGGRDYISHFTILEGDVPEGQQVDAEAFARLAGVVLMDGAGPFPKSVGLDEAIFGPDGSVIVVSYDIPRLLVEARETLARTYSKYGLTARNINFFHTSQARVLGWKSFDGLRAFAHAVEDISNSKAFFNGRLQVPIRRIHAGSTWNLFGT